MQIRDYLSSNVIICILYFNYFREVGQKYTYIFFCFLVQMKTSKSHSEINRPLAGTLQCVEGLIFYMKNPSIAKFQKFFELPKPPWSAQTVENSHSFYNVSYTQYKSLGDSLYVVTINSGFTVIYFYLYIALHRYRSMDLKWIFILVS